MSSDYMKFDTLTVGLGEEPTSVEPVGPQPVPVLARVPRVQGTQGMRRRLDAASHGQPAVEEVGSFQVTTGQAMPVPRSTATPAVAPVASKSAPKSSPIAKPMEAAIPQPVPPKDESWATTLLKMQASSHPTRKLFVWVLLAAVAGASLMLFRSGSEVGSSSPVELGPAPEWKPAPLAGPAPPFVPNSTVQKTVATVVAPTVVPPTVVGPEAPTANTPQATGPVSMARRQSATAPAERVAALPTPYPSTGLAPSQAPAAKLIGVQPIQQAPVQPPANATRLAQPPSTIAPSRNEQNRPSLY